MARITIIDDDVEFAQSIAELLEAGGHAVTVICTMTNAVSSLIESDPDVLLLDMMFPDNPIAGLEIARELRQVEDTKNLPIIMFSSVNNEFPMDFSSDDAGSDWMPVNEYVDKSTPSSKLLRRINDIINTRP